MSSKLSDERDQKLKPLVDKIRIEESHQYCQSLGLDKESIGPMAGLNGRELESFVACNSGLSTYSQQIFRDIYRDFSDRNDLFVLSDAAARLIMLHACPEILSAATDDVGLRCGVLLSETSCGTNAVALALRYHEPMMTSGAQHYCRLLKRWAAVAVPVLDADQRPVACIAILNGSDASLGEKLLLAKFIVKEFEKFYKSQSAPPPIVKVNSDTQVKPASLPVGLTARQKQVLLLFAQGMSYKQIAREIGIGSYKTVEEHLDAVREKLHVSHRRECIQRAMSLGLL